MYVAEAWLVRLEGFAMGGVRLVQSLCGMAVFLFQPRRPHFRGTNQENKGRRDNYLVRYHAHCALETGEQKGGRVGMSDGGVVIFLVLFCALLVRFGNIWFFANFFLSLSYLGDLDACCVM